VEITPIPIDGTLLFYIQLPKSIIMMPSTQLELSVADIYGTEYKTTQHMGDWIHR
jgi:hypothetical protein